MAAELLRETGPGRGRAGLGLRADARLRARLPRRALRDRPRRGRRAGRRRPQRRADRRSGRLAGERRDPAPRADRQRLTARLPVCRTVMSASGRRRSAVRGGWRRRTSQEPSFFQDPKRLAQTGGCRRWWSWPRSTSCSRSWSAIEDGIHKLGDGDPVWIGVALAFSVLMFFSYVGLFKGVVGEAISAALDRELPDHDGRAGGHAPVLGGRRRRHRPDLLGAAQGRDAAARVGGANGRLPRAALRRLHVHPR